MLGVGVAVGNARTLDDALCDSKGSGARRLRGWEMEILGGGLPPNRNGSGIKLSPSVLS